MSLDIGEINRATAEGLGAAAHRSQRHIYDLAHKHYLLGRDEMIEALAPPPGAGRRDDLAREFAKQAAAKGLARRHEAPYRGYALHDVAVFAPGPRPD